MKKYYIVFLLIAVSLVSCDGFLDTKDYTNKNDQNFPLTEKDANMSLASCYHVMASLQEFSSYYVGDMLSDDRFGGGGPNDFNQQAWDQMKKSTENMQEQTWIRLYQGVFRANKLLETMGQIVFETETAKNTVMGETYFMRAYFYFELTKMFGDVPLLTTSESINIPRTEASEVFAQIASDLKKAIELLPSTSYASQLKSNLGHATKWAAEGMLARAFLFYTGYYGQTSLPIAGGGELSDADIVTYLEDCINNSGHRLVEDYRNMWPYTNALTGEDYAYNKDKNLSWVGDDNNIETVFAIKFGTKGDWSNKDYANMVALCWSLRGQSSYANVFPFGQGWGQGPVNPRFIEDWIKYEPNDTIRRKGSVLDIRDPEEGVRLYEEGGWEQMQDGGYWQKKYIAINAWTDKETRSFKGYSTLMFGGLDDYSFINTQDQVLLRYADILLMHSELTKTTKGINMVRERAKLLPVAGYTQEILRNERRFELAFEGYRYFDLLRWYGKNAGVEIDKNQNGVKVLNNRVETTINYNLTKRIQETGGFLQVPQSEIDLSDGVLTQTPGWTSSDIVL